VFGKYYVLVYIKLTVLVWQRISDTRIKCKNKEKQLTKRLDFI
jgi:hypothetical protein